MLGRGKRAGTCHRCSERGSVLIVAGRRAAAVERPVRVRVGTSENVADRWLGEKVAEFEAWLQQRCEELVVHGTPTGESNPAATSSSWWQGPPLGLSQMPGQRRHASAMTAFGTLSDAGSTPPRPPQLRSPAPVASQAAWHTWCLQPACQTLPASSRALVESKTTLASALAMRF